MILKNITIRLRNNIDNITTKIGILFLAVSWFFIILSLIIFTVSTLPNLSTQTKRILLILEYLITFVFLVEYITRLLATKAKLKFVFSFYGIIDLLAILPVFLGLFNLHFVRIFSLFRLLRVLKLFRYSKSLNQFFNAIKSIKEQLVIFIAISVLIIYLSSVGIYFFEHETQPEVFASIIHSMWWSVATLTTVGYGDIYPITTGGKIFTFFILIIGLGIVAVPTALIASALTKQQND